MKALINWVNLHKCNLINTSDINTYHSYSSQSSLIYWILNKVQKTLNSIQKIEISHFKKSWDQEIEYLMKLQIEIAKSETCETINMHYKELERIIKKMKNIMIYIDALQIQKKKAKIKTEIEMIVIFTHELIRCSKATSVSDKIIITKAKL